MCYLKIYDWMVDDERLNGLSLLVYAKIYSFEESGASFTGSTNFLADLFHCSARGIQKVLKYLMDEGMITKETQGGTVCLKTVTGNAKKANKVHPLGANKVRSEANKVRSEANKVRKMANKVRCSKSVVNKREDKLEEADASPSPVSVPSLGHGNPDTETGVSDTLFAEFISAYPVHRRGSQDDIDEALALWRSLDNITEAFPRIMSVIHFNINDGSWSKLNNRYMPSPVRMLKDRYWEKYQDIATYPEYEEEVERLMPEKVAKEKEEMRKFIQSSADELGV